MKVSLTPHQEKFIAKKMKSGGYLSEEEIVREALRQSLSSPLKKYQAGHFAALAKQSGR